MFKLSKENLKHLVDLLAALEIKEARQEVAEAIKLLLDSKPEAHSKHCSEARKLGILCRHDYFEYAVERQD